MFLLTITLNLFNFIASLRCPGGEIGRHARFRFWCRKVCRFESYPGHISGSIFRNENVFRFFSFYNPLDFLLIGPKW
jgi:hypothetical protein